MKLKEKALKGIKWDTFATVAIAGGSLLQLFILVRFIDKSDFGLMAMVNVVITFIITFLDFGVSSGIIHQPKISDQQLSVLYFITIGMGIFFSLFLYLFSPFIAAFYNEEQLLYLLKVLSILFFIQSIGLQFRVLLVKELQFELLSKIDIFVFTAAFLVTVLMAVYGYGVMALVVGRLVKATIESTLLFFFGKSAFSLNWKLKIENVNYFLKFGAFQMGERFLNFFNKQMDVILVGKFLGAEALGVYDIIKRLLNRPLQIINPIINKVSFPLMSKVQKDDQMVRNYYLKQLNYICTLNFAIYMFLFFNAELILQFALGPGWGEHKWIFSIMSMYFLIYASGNPVGTLLLSRGRPDLGFYWNLVIVFMISGFVYFGINGGLKGVVFALLVAQCLLVIPNYIFLVNKAVPIKFKDYFFTLGLPFVLALTLGIVTIICSGYLHFSAPINILILVSFALFVFFLLNFRFNRKFIDDLGLLLKI